MQEDSVFSKSMLPVLRMYEEELSRWNVTTNFISRKTTARQHIADCLTGTEVFTTLITQHYTSAPPTILDIGSGAGLPGIPIALYLYDKKIPCQIVLLDRSQKKCRFLEYIHLKIMDILSDECFSLSVVCSDIKTYTKSLLRNPIDIITCRAFHPLDKSLVTQLQNLSHKNTYIILYKGNKTHIQQEIADSSATAMLQDIIPVTSNGSRHIVVLRPQAPLPKTS